MLPRRLALVSAVLLGTGCADPDVEAKCLDLRDALCDNILAECPVGDYTEEDCQAEAREMGWDCDEILDVTDRYDDCMEAVVASDECLSLVGLPESCEGVLLSEN